ncbi:ubiquitin-specific protease doa4 [Massospora cicadina]|nr:ubiquitin-specific protease doa4 [Massospora cicadina]
MTLIKEALPYNRNTCPRWRYINEISLEPPNPDTKAKEWFEKCLRRCERADSLLLETKREDAYVYYLRAIDIFLNKVLKAPDYSDFKRQNAEKLARFNKTLETLYKNAERLKALILEQYENDYETQKKNLRPASSDPASARVPAKNISTDGSDSNQPLNISCTALSNSSHNIAIKPNVRRARDTPIYVKSTSQANGTKFTLFLDVREPYKFKMERLNVNFTINIDPLLLPKDVSSAKIETDLDLHSADPANLFCMRDRFDLVVVLDESSTQLTAPEINAGGVFQNPLHNLVLAITEYEPTKRLKRRPLLLEGGFRAWKGCAGPAGVAKLSPLSKKHEHALRRNAISPARSKPIVKTLEQFVRISRFDFNFQFRQSQEPYGKISMQTPSPLNSTPSLELQNPILSPLVCGSVEGSLDSNHSIASPVDSLTALRKRTVFDNPLYGFTSTKVNAASEDAPPPSLESLYFPPGEVEPPDACSVPPSGPPPLPPKPKVLKAARPCTPPLVSSLSYAMNIGTTGLRNLGNTCYMNSIIQCINGTIPLSRYFLGEAKLPSLASNFADGSFKMHINRDNPLGYGGLLVDAFVELVRVLWTEGASYVSPIKFKAAVARASSQFQGNEQQDSQVFLAFLLDGLHEDLNLVRERPPPDDDSDPLEKLSDQEASDFAWERHLQRNNSIIVSLFQGQLKSRLQCGVCSEVSVTFNTFMYLSLPIPDPKAGPVHLLDCLELFIQEETLVGENAWFCPRCRCARPSTKRLTISRLPDVLLIHLKRFSYEGPFRNKLDTDVTIPARGLNLESYVPKTAPKSSILSPKGTPIGNSYDLYAVSNHFGSLNGGHYTASVRSGFGGKWHYFDDSRVTTITEKEAVTKAAYNLFYVRTNSETAHL